MGTSNAVSKAIIPAHGQVSFGIRLHDLADRDPNQARNNIERLVRGLQQAQSITVLYRYLLGKQLILIRDNGLWQDLGTAGQEAPRTFTDWIKNHFTEIASTSHETAFNAMALAVSPLLNKVGEDTIRSMTSVSNAYALVKAERRGLPVNEETVAESSTASVAAFREKVLQEPGPSRGVIHATTDSAKHAAALADIIVIIKNADHRALKALAKTIQQVLPLAGDNATDAVDFINAALQEAILSTTAADKEATRTSDVPIEDDDEPDNRIEP